MEIKEKIEMTAQCVKMEAELRRIYAEEEKLGALQYFRQSYEPLVFLGLHDYYEKCTDPVEKLILIKKTADLDAASDKYQFDKNWPDYRKAIDAWFDFMVARLPEPVSLERQLLCA